MNYLGTAVFVVAAVAAARQQPAPPVFRASVDRVAIDVSVRSGNRPVAGLSAADFVLSDNGVRQAIEVVTAGAVPLDVTVILEVSLTHWPLAAANRLAARELEQRLQPGDRLRLLLAGTHVVQERPFGTEGSPAIEVRPDQFSSLHEALVAALVYQPSGDRRHLIVAITDGFDNMSAVPAATVAALARQTGAVLHLVLQNAPRRRWLEAFELNRVPLPHPPLLRGEAHPRFRGMLVDAAETTGGSTVFSQGDQPGAERLVRAFSDILDGYRNSYVLLYAPTGGVQKGWHEVRVQLTRRGRFELRARRGYFVETPSP